jgi:type I restriction enzyme S subunit
MSGLPEGWAHATLSLLCKQPEQRVPLADEMFTYIDIASVDRDLKTVSEPQRLLGADAPSRARKLVESGDVIVSMTRPNLNAVALIDEQYNDCVASTGFDVLKPIEVEPRWIFAAVRSARFVDAMCEKVQGALYPAVKSADIREFEIPLPPLAEQTRIAQKLDELLAQVDTLKARIDGIPALLKRFRQSVLAAAVSGRLTEEWRKENNLGAWDKKTLAELSKRLHQGINTSADKVEYSEVGTPILQAKHITSGKIECEDARNVGKEIFEKYQEKYCPPTGSILFTNIGTIGRSVVIYKKPNFLIAWNIFLIEPNSLVAPMYLQINLELLRATGYYEGLYRGGATQFVNKKQLSEIEIPLPSIDEQVEIVRRVDQLFAFADQLEAKVASAKSRIDHLTQSILAKAFRGELVPQDPNDEPASVLLERIKAQRAATPKAKRGRKSA